MAGEKGADIRVNLLPPTKAQTNAVSSQIKAALKNIKLNVKVDVNETALTRFREKARKPINIKIDVDKRGLPAVKSMSAALNTLRSEVGLLRSDVQSLSRDFSNLNTTVLRTGGTLKNTVASTKAATAAQRNLARGIGLTTNQFQEFGRLSILALKRFSAFTVSTTIVFGLGYALKNAVSEAIEFDRTLVKISQVTGTSTSGLKGLTQEITNLSVSLGIPSKELSEVALVLAQTGQSAKDTKTILSGLAKSTLAPTFGDIKNTTEGVIAALAQFNLQAGETESILGSINKVAAEFPVEADDIISAIRKTGGVFAAGSKGIVDSREALNQFIATFTAVRSTTREGADTIATGLRTIFTRIQRPQTINLLKEFGVELTNSEGKFVGLFNAVNLLSNGLQGLVSGQPDVRIAKIVEELGGFRQVGKTLPLLTELKKRQDALTSARKGTNSLDQDVIRSQEALGRQLDKVRENFTALVREIVSSNGFKILIGLITDAANAAINLARSLKTVAPILAALAAARAIPKVADFFRGVRIGSRDKSTGASTGLSSILTLSTGGRVGGTGRGDKIPAMLEPGEFVVPTDSARQYSPSFLEALRQGKVRGYADGGTVGGNIGGSEGFDDLSKKLGRQFRILGIRVEDQAKIFADIGRSLTKLKNTLEFATKEVEFAGQNVPIGSRPDNTLSSVQVLAGADSVAAQKAAAREVINRNKAIKRGRKYSTLQGVLEDAGITPSNRSNLSVPKKSPKPEPPFIQLTEADFAENQFDLESREEAAERVRQQKQRDAARFRKNRQLSRSISGVPNIAVRSKSLDEQIVDIIDDPNTGRAPYRPRTLVSTNPFDVPNPFFGPGFSGGGGGGGGGGNPPNRFFGGRFSGLASAVAGRSGLAALGGLGVATTQIGDETPERAALSSGILGGISGGAIGSVAGPAGIAVGAIVGTLSSAVNAFNEKLESNALDKFNKSLDTATAALEKNIAANNILQIESDFKKLLDNANKIGEVRENTANGPAGSLTNFGKSLFSEFSNDFTKLGGLALTGTASPALGILSAFTGDTSKRTLDSFAGNISSEGNSPSTGFLDSFSNLTKSFFSAETDKAAQTKDINQRVELAKPIAEAAGRTIESLLRNGKSVDDIGINTLIAAISADKDVQLRESQGLNDSATGRLATDRQAKANAQSILDRINLEKKFEIAARAASERLGTLVNDLGNLEATLALNTENLDRFANTLTDSFSVLSGNAGVSVRTSNPFENFRGLSQGRLGGELDRITSSLPVLNPFANALEEVKRLEVELPKLFSDASTIGPEDPVKDRGIALKQSIEALKLPKVIQDSILSKLDSELNGTTPTTRQSFESFLQNFDVDSLSGEIRNKLVSVFKESQDQLNTVTQQYVSNLNNQLQAQLSINAKKLAADQTSANISLEVARIRGRELSLAELQNPINNEIRTLSDTGSTNPGLIGDRIGVLLDQRRNLQDRIESNPENLALLDALSTNTSQLTENQQALELLANDTRRLANVQGKIQQQQQKEQLAKASIEQLIFGGPEAQLEFRRRTNIAGRVLEGDTRGVTGQDLQGVFETLRQIGNFANTGLINGVPEGSLPEQQVNEILGKILGPLAAQILPELNQGQVGNVLSNKPTATTEVLIAEFEKLSNVQVDALNIQANLQQQILDAIREGNRLQAEQGRDSIDAAIGANPDIAPQLRNSGGLIPGRGPNRDTVPAYLTKGEFVVNRAATDANYDLLAAINNGYVNGGRVRQITESKMLTSQAEDFIDNNSYDLRKLSSIVHSGEDDSPRGDFLNKIQKKRDKDYFDGKVGLEERYNQDSFNAKLLLERRHGQTHVHSLEDYQGAKATAGSGNAYVSKNGGVFESKMGYGAIANHELEHAYQQRYTQLGPLSEKSDIHSIRQFSKNVETLLKEDKVSEIGPSLGDLVFLAEQGKLDFGSKSVKHNVKIGNKSFDINQLMQLANQGGYWQGQSMHNILFNSSEGQNFLKEIFGGLSNDTGRNIRPSHYNSGGVIPGRGPNTDTVPAYLTKGEFVVNRQATDENFDLLMAINNGYARGGYVSAGRQKMLDRREKRRVSIRADLAKARANKTNPMRLNTRGLINGRPTAEVINNIRNKNLPIHTGDSSILRRNKRDAKGNFGLYLSMDDRGEDIGRISTGGGALASAVGIRFGPDVQYSGYRTKEIKNVGRRMGVGFNSGGKVGTSKASGQSTMGNALVKFNDATKQLTAAMNPFMRSMDNFAKTLQSVNIPSTIEMNAKHTVIVELNGATVLAAMQETLRDLVMTEVNKAIRKTINVVTGETKEAVIPR